MRRVPGARRSSRAIVAAAALVTASCGARLMKLPPGPGVPAPNAASAVDDATRACRAIRTITAEIAVSGSVGGRRLRGRLIAGLAAPASARLEAPAPFGQPVFIFVARDDDATVLLPRDQRVLEHGRPAAVLEAVTGVSLDPAELRTTLTGCADAAPVDQARALASGWLMIPGPKQLYLRQSKPADPWRIVAAIAHDSSGAEWRAEYSDFADGLPRAIRLASTGSNAFNLGLRLSQIETNVALGDDAFRVQVPRSAVPITLGELRQAGPLAERGQPASDGR
jgi:hypothetical protein